MSLVSAFWLRNMYSNCNINKFFMFNTVLVVFKCHGTGINILHGRVNLMVRRVSGNTPILSLMGRDNFNYLDMS